VLNGRALAAALASSDVSTALNPFSSNGSGYPSAEVRGAALTSIVQDQMNVNTNKFTDVQGQLDGNLFRLPAGFAKLAVGLEYQASARTASISAVNGAGGGPNPEPLITPRLTRAVFSAFGELFVPLAQRLDLSIAGRYDRYDDDDTTNDIGILDADTFNPRIGLTWRWLDGLKFRGSWGKSFRAPLLGDYTYGAPTVTFPAQISAAVAAAHGLPGAGAYTATVVQGGHVFGLQPEKATNWTLGFDWRPVWAQGLSLGVTYYNVKFTDQFTSPAAADLLTDPNYVDVLIGTASYFVPGAGLVVFNPTTEQLQQYLAFGGPTTPKFGPAPALLYGSASTSTAGQAVPVYLLVEGLTRNGGVMKTDGLDFSLSYRRETGIGTFSFSDTFTYILNYDQSLVAGAALVDSLNQVNFPLRFVNRSQLRLERGGFSGSLFINYLNAYDNKTVTPSAKVKAYVTTDLSLSLGFGDDAAFSALRNGALTFAAQNLVDSKPPRARVVQGVAAQNFDSQNASALGRMLRLQVSKKF
jgi:iron complex outermembrane receptor protein